MKIQKNRVKTLIHKQMLSHEIVLADPNTACIPNGMDALIIDNLHDLDDMLTFVRVYVCVCTIRRAALCVFRQAARVGR